MVQMIGRMLESPGTDGDPQEVDALHIAAKLRETGG